MINWIKDVIGINKYVVAWRIQFPTHVSRGTKFILTKRFAQRVADGMNCYYGSGTHWIERVQ